MIRREHDWERIEADYRAGIMSVNEVAALHNVPQSTLRARAVRYSWERAMRPAARARADSIVAASEASGGEDRRLTDDEIVDGCAAAMASVRLSHRRDIAKTREIAKRLMLEIEALTGDDRDLYARIAGLIKDKQMDRGRAGQAFAHITSLPGRVKALRELTEVMKGVVALERQAYGMDEASIRHESDALSSLLASISSRNSSSIDPVLDDPAYKEDGGGDE